jgi:hypothetical protein
LGHQYENVPALILPLLLLIPLSYVTRLNGLIQHLGGYRKALEERINSIYGKVLLPWEGNVAPLQKRSVNAYVLYGLMICLWCALVGYAEWVIARSHLSLLESIGLQIGYALGGLLVLSAWITGLEIFGKAYQASIRAFEGSQITISVARTAPGRPVVGIVAFSFGTRGAELEPSPCNERLAQAVATVASMVKIPSVIVAQWEVARALEALGIEHCAVGSGQESYLETETVWKSAENTFQRAGVTHVIPVAQPFLHLFAVRRLISQSGHFVLWSLPIASIGWDRTHLNRQWWTRSPARFLFYAMLRLARLPGIDNIRRRSRPV